MYCQNLKELYLIGLTVNWPEISDDFFRQNMKLTKLALINTNMTQIRGSWLRPLEELEVLSLRNNMITAFPPPDESFVLDKVKAIFLDNNCLESIDIDSLLMHFPNLKYLSVSKNQFLCSEFNRILSFSQKNGVQVNAEDVECFAF